MVQDSIVLVTSMMDLRPRNYMYIVSCILRYPTDVVRYQVDLCLIKVAVDMTPHGSGADDRLNCYHANLSNRKI